MNVDRSGEDKPVGNQFVEDRRRTVLALFAGWLVPGLGHVVIGRLRRGIFFTFLIFFCFGMGLAHDGKVALRNSEQPFLSTMQLLANAGVGAADMVVRLSVYGEPAYTLPVNTTHPVYEDRVNIMRTRARSGVSTYGSAYLWTAGLMNLLLLFDVWDIGRGRKA
jgi:hypothetical protein